MVEVKFGEKYQTILLAEISKILIENWNGLRKTGNLCIKFYRINVFHVQTIAQFLYARCNLVEMNLLFAPICVYQIQRYSYENYAIQFQPANEQ